MDETLTRDLDPAQSPDLGRAQSPDLGRAQSRVEKIERTLARRQPTLAVIMENIHDPHNFNAILRSCDATGVLRVAMVYNIEKEPRLVHTSSSGANKWSEIEGYRSMAECCDKLRRDGFQIFATKLEPTARSLYTHDYTRPTAFIIGNEHRGISPEAEEACDELLYIPMMGMVESLNVSVATAVCLFEAMRQRHEAGMYDAPQMSETDIATRRREWLTK